LSDAPVDVAVQQQPLSDEQRSWLELAWAEVNAGDLARLDAGLVNIPSPTGEEREIAEFLASRLRTAGLEGRYQPIDDRQGNAMGRLRGSGGGPALLLYAPTDTAFAGSAEEDVPWLGPTIRRDFQPHALVDGDTIVGLGAENPKAYVTCVVAAAEAVVRAGVPLVGDLLLGLGAGGMPTNKRPGLARHNIGQGSGCSFMLEQGFRGDFAILAKPGYAVSWEEVGLCWFKVRVGGEVNYTGIRHKTPYRNPIVAAARVIDGLEAWFADYSEGHRSGLVAPQGSIGAIESGWTYKPSFVPAACDLYVDVRISPRTDPAELNHEFAEALGRIRAGNPRLELAHDMILSIPGTHTTPQNWIVQSLMRGWETVEGEDHKPILNTSGATDAAILRGRGIPTARLGLPRFEVPAAYPGFSMGVVSVAAMERLTRCIIYSIVDTCTRSRPEVGLGY
jgi:acetylornithine deacetylase/succinyl-diaminopimelate desuccinylase-like protein